MRLAIDRAGVISVALWAALSISCQQSGSTLIKGITTGDALDGEWVMIASIDSNSCSLASTVYPISGTIDIVQTGAALNVGEEGCCCLVARATGSLQGTSMVLTSTRAVSRDASCTLKVEENDVATVGADRFSGNASLLVSDPGGTCGAGSPCQMHATFVATRCLRPKCGHICTLACPTGETCVSP